MRILVCIAVLFFCQGTFSAPAGNSTSFSKSLEKPQMLQIFFNMDFGSKQAGIINITDNANILTSEPKMARNDSLSSIAPTVFQQQTDLKNNSSDLELLDILVETTDKPDLPLFRKSGFFKSKGNIIETLNSTTSPETPDIMVGTPKVIKETKLKNNIYSDGDHPDEHNSDKDNSNEDNLDERSITAMSQIKDDKKSAPALELTKDKTYWHRQRKC